MSFAIVPGSCPEKYRAGPGTCLRECPTARQFAMQAIDSRSYKCVYTPDPTKSVTPIAISVPVYGSLADIPKGIPTLQAIKAKALFGDSTYQNFTNENARFDSEVETIVANVEKEKKIAAAFKSLQTAENARDTAPLAYQQARTTYYTLLKGDTWKQEEQERLAKAEVDPEINRMKSSLSDAQRRLAQQQKTVDIVNGLKDNVLTLKDDFKYSADTLQKQIGKLRDQIVFDRRKREEQNNGAIWDLIDRVLNYAIVAVLAFATFMIYKSMKSPQPVSQEAPPVVGGGIGKFLTKYMPIPALR